ncbi:MAG TPA: hypothetical protein ENJ86_09950 [Methylothermaceae bacterium]|nr:hypothetical protein [Methylothermaceae bacterium]
MKKCIHCNEKFGFQEFTSFCLQRHSEVFKCVVCQTPNFLVVPQAKRGVYSFLKLLAFAVAFMPAIVVFAYTVFWVLQTSNGAGGGIITGTIFATLGLAIFRIINRPLIWKLAELKKTTFEE